MLKRTAVAVIGCGYWGSKHVRVLSGLADVRQVAIVEPDPQSRAAILSAFPATRAFPDLKSALPHIDAVVIATPPQTHTELGLTSLRSGKHVLVEKPLAKSLEEARLLVSEARRSNSVLMTGHTFLFNPAVKELRNRLVRGELGEVYYIYSARLNLGVYRCDVNVVWDLAPHDITIMNYLLHSVPTAVNAWSGSLARENVNDIAYIRLDYGKLGVSAFIQLSWLDPRKVRTVTVVGKNKMAVYDDLAEERLRIYDRGVKNLEDGSPPHNRPLSYRYGDIISPHIPAEEPLALEDQHFLDCICTRANPESSGRDGMLVVAILEAIDRALHKGITIEVDYPVDLSEVDDIEADAVIGNEFNDFGVRAAALRRTDERILMTGIPFNDLSPMHAEVSDQLDEAWRELSRSSKFIGGEFVERFEAEWAQYCDMEYCVGLSSGTAALELTLRALGIGPGAEVIVPANTFIATAEAVAAVGAQVVFVDVDASTLLITAANVENALTHRTAGVIVVHLYGQPADMDSINRVARAAGIAVIEDAAQAHGATWRGKPVGSLSDVGCFSFYPGKNLGAFGDAGAVVTRDSALAECVRSLSNHGRPPDAPHLHQLIGASHRLDALQAAILSIKLKQLDAWNAARKRAADRYKEVLSGLAVHMVEIAENASSSHHLTVIQTAHRNELRQSLAAEGIASGIHYPVPCHQQHAFLTDKTPCLPVVERAADRILSLPMFPKLTNAQIERVADAIHRALANLEQEEFGSM